jgi:hypothetical protein
MTRHIACVILMVPLFGMVAMAQEGVASTWPQDVPRNYVITPFGYFHPTCVRHVLEGETVLEDGRIRYEDGSVEASAPACNYPRYSPQGVRVNGHEPTTNGWVESASAMTSTSYKRMIVTWAVPPDPGSYNGQTVFLFPGFEDYKDVVSILQPVLQYGSSAAGGGEYWSVAAWNCCPGGTADYSSLIGANNGTVGTIWSNCNPGVNKCATWNVEAKETGSGQTTTLTATPSEGQEFNWAFGAALEVYGITQCDQYPSFGNTGDSFTVQLYDNEGNLINHPGWTGQVTSGIAPWCGFNVSTSPTRERLGWQP